PQANRAVAGDRLTAQVTAEGKDVVIIGGGDTGADCLGTATRQGARSITQLEIMPRPGDERPADQPWPTYPLTYRTTSAHQEAGERLYAVATREFLGDEDGNVDGLQLVEVERTETGFDEVAGTEQRIRAQLVLLALGFTGPVRHGLVDQLGLGVDESGNLS